MFCSRITLEDKIGQKYEPYIFAALNSAPVMIALGTRPEYFNAVWVRNEWSRFLNLIKNGAKKFLIPAFKDMSPHELPDELSHLQAQDMGKIGAVQDLIRGVKKLIRSDSQKTEKVIITGNQPASAPLLKRAFMFLEDGDFENAGIYCERVLDIDPENAEAYLAKLMVEKRVKSRSDLANCAQPFDDSRNYRNAIRFGDDKLISELEEYINNIRERVEQESYNKAVQEMDSANYQQAIEFFKSIEGFRDSSALIKKCQENIEKIRKEEQARIKAKNATENLLVIFALKNYTVKQITINKYLNCSLLIL